MHLASIGIADRTGVETFRDGPDLLAGVAVPRLPGLDDVRAITDCAEAILALGLMKFGVMHHQDGVHAPNNSSGS